LQRHRNGAFAARALALAGALAVAGALGLGPALSRAQSAPATGTGAAPSAPPGARSAPPEGVPLERLLKIPASAGALEAEPRRGGRTRGEWRARFEAAEAALVLARKEADDARRKLEEVAPDQAWSMGAPGLPVQVAPAETPIDYRLRETLRRKREEVDRAERRLQDLSIEANLAQVPDEWRRPEAEAGSDAAAGADSGAERGPGAEEGVGAGGAQAAPGSGS